MGSYEHMFVSYTPVKGARRLARAPAYTRARAQRPSRIVPTRSRVDARPIATVARARIHARTRAAPLANIARPIAAVAGRADARQSIVSGPSAAPARNWRTKAFSEVNIRSASPASTIRPRHRSAMYSPIWRAEAMLWVTTT